MNKGQQRFYLREVHAHWTQPRIVEDRVTELADARLVERFAQQGSRIRLTKEGERQKVAARPQTDSTLPLVKKSERSPQNRRVFSRLSVPRPLV